MKDSSQVKKWWTGNPMTYAKTHGSTAYDGREIEIGSKEFFDRVDERFYKWNRPLHDERPFGRLFPFEAYGAGSSVLEVGCGMGTMAMLWALNGASVTAVDLNETSIEQTRRRFKVHGLEGRIESADARELALDDASFDYVYSWGVLHHSPDLDKSISEVMRVVRPGGGFGIMVYNRRSIRHWYMTAYIEGFLHCEKDHLDSLQLASRYGDGARQEGNPHTWPMTPGEMCDLLGKYSSDAKIRILGTELDTVFKFMLPGLGVILPRFMKKPWARRYGWSIWVEGHKD